MTEPPRPPGSSLTLAAPAQCQRRDEGAEQHTTNNLSKGHRIRPPGLLIRTDKRKTTTDLCFPVLALFSVLQRLSSLHYIFIHFNQCFISFSPPLGPLGDTWRVKANTGENSERNRTEERRRMMRKREREARWTTLRSKARSHCEDCTIECCMEYGQTKHPSAAVDPLPPQAN